VSPRIKHNCEICGAEVTKVVHAINCKHMIYLCEECKRVCPGALKVCIDCENLGR